MKSKVLNLTKHRLTVIAMDDVVPKDRYSDKFRLKDPLKCVKPILQVDPITPLNVHETKGLGTDFNIEGIHFQAAPCYTQSIDGLNGLCFDNDELMVVSKKYADAAKNVLHPYFLDRLFIPAGLVERDGQIIGCTKLLKVASFYYPSVYLTMPSDFASKRMAAEYWKLRWNQLPASEQDALQVLSQYA